MVEYQKNVSAVNGGNGKKGKKTKAETSFDSTAETIKVIDADKMYL